MVIGDSGDATRERLRNQLAGAPDIEVVGETDDGERALRLLRELRPEVALLDRDLPSFGGAAVARILSRELPEIRVVVMGTST